MPECKEMLRRRKGRLGGEVVRVRQVRSEVSLVSGEKKDRGVRGWGGSGLSLAGIEKLGM